VPLRLKPHPRLYLSEAGFARLKDKTDSPVVLRAIRSIRRLAQGYVLDPEIPVDRTGHNYHLIRARKMQNRVFTLLAAYKLTNKRAYRDTLVNDIRRMAGWEYWSWITWRQNDPRPEAIFDLSYGENSATLAVAYDILREELTEEERKLCLDTARKRSLLPYLAVNGGREKSWYYKSPNSNWNTVCNGGAGMLALAAGSDMKESARVVELVEKGVAPFFKSLDGDGGWPEGIGYWNYGMRYGFMYLLSHEAATGRRHPLLRRAGTEATLSFPLTFTPNDQPCSFGDVNSYRPLPFHLAAAERFGRSDLVDELDRRLKRCGPGDGGWPNEAEIALLHPRKIAKKKALAGKRHHLLKGLEWGYVADRMPDPNLYVSVRGGTTDAPHVHRDLMSFHVVVGKEKMIDNVPVEDYIDTTFSSRRFELYETAASSKNAIFVNGVGVADRSTVQTKVVEGRGYRGFRIDATSAMGEMRDGRMVDFCGRLILLLKEEAVLVVDRIEVPHVALVESRMHTFLSAKFNDGEALISGKRERLHVSYDSTEPTRLKQGMGMQTHPATDGDTILRYVTTGKISEVTLATLMVPNGNGKVSIRKRGTRTIVRSDGDVQSSVGFETVGLRI
jgi:hypothetical protein